MKQFSRLYYGGGQKRPDGMYPKSIKNASGQVISLVGQSNRKDIRNAVEAAQKAQPGWAKRSGKSTLSHFEFNKGSKLLSRVVKK